MRKYSLVVISVCFFSLAIIAQQTDTIKVKVHDHVMTLYSSGVGKPTVILEAGGGSNHRTWQLVQPKIANSARVVSYDRPGYLNSDTCSSPRDAITIATELKEALLKANIYPPYIIAGWSYGGSLVRVFAGLYPADVKGMVLVDPAPEEVYARLEKEFPEVMKEDEKYVKEILASKTRPGEREEMRMYDSSMNQGRRSDPLHATPTTLLIAAGKADGGQDRDTTNPMNRVWVEELVKWAKKRPNLEHRIISNSGHHIARFQPDTVVNAIRDHISRYQAQALIQAATPYKKPAQLKDGIQTATLKEVGLDEKIIQQMTDSIINGNYPNIHSVLILRNNKLVYENYFPGYDQVRARGRTGFIDHHRDSLHDLRSVTKSFVGACVMIAMDQSKIKSPDQRVFDFFPEYAKHDTGMKREITIRHLLTMSSGLDWNEHISYMDSSNSETRMDRSKDPVEFFLSQRLVDKPGTKFNYSAGCTHTLAVIVERTTGMSIDRFAVKNLFQPLGITDFAWVKRRDGIPITASGLRLRSRDMAKFGLLYLNGGKWNNKQVITSNAITQLSKEQLSTPYTGGPISKVGYSYQIWLYTYRSAGKSPVIQGNGNGGQIITIDKESDLVLIATAGNYNSRDIRKQSDELYPDFIYPAILKR
ncbi:MAG TPA: alpha/beta fold hydrolase [Chitinophagaceae bacterium]|nr:alpha/beta fold hydrolase [Chitinophagaceae bacterium]